MGGVSPPRHHPPPGGGRHPAALVYRRSTSACCETTGRSSARRSGRSRPAPWSRAKPPRWPPSASARGRRRPRIRPAPGCPPGTSSYVLAEDKAMVSTSKRSAVAVQSGREQQPRGMDRRRAIGPAVRLRSCNRGGRGGGALRPSGGLAWWRRRRAMIGYSGLAANGFPSPGWVAAMRDPDAVWSFPWDGCSRRFHVQYLAALVMLELRWNPSDRGPACGSGTIVMGLLFGSVLLHEFTIFAAPAVDSSATKSCCGRWGGLAYCDLPHSPKAHLICGLVGRPSTSSCAAQPGH